MPIVVYRKLDMETRYIAALIAFLGGSVISVFNAVLTAKQVVSEHEIKASVTLLRQLLNFAYFFGTWFVSRKLGIDYMLPLIGAAIGLTVPSILLSITIAKNMKGDEEKWEKPQK